MSDHCRSSSQVIQVNASAKCSSFAFGVAASPRGGCTLFDHEAMFFATTLRSIPYVLSSSAPCLRSPRLQVFSTRNKGHNAPKIRRRPCDIFSCCVLASVYTRLVGGVWIRARRRCEVEPWFVSISTIMYSLFFIYSLLF